MKKRTRIILISILSLLVIALMTLFVFATINYASRNKAHAEYSDITQDTIVSFNQLFKYNSIANSSAFTKGTNGLINIIVSGNFEYSTNTTIDLIQNHKYFIYINSDCNTGIELYKSGVLSRNIYNTEIYNSSVTNTLNVYIRRQTGGNTGYLYAYIIDLTQMFGNNEPNLEQAKNIFKAKYYNYTTGTPMFWGLNQNDMFQHIEYSFNTGLLSGYSQNITNTNVSYDSDGNLILTGTYSDNYSAYYLINLKTTIPIGSVVTINFNSYTKQSGSACAIVYADNYETLITSIPSTSNYSNPYSYSFITDREISAFYMICDYYTTGTIMTIQDANISVQFSDDYQFNLQAQYDLGYSDAETYYTNGYGHTQIYMDGYNYGYSKGLEEGALSDGWNFIGTLFAGIGSVFSLQIFPNVTIGTFILIPLLLGLIFFIVKLSRGGS